MAIKECKKIWYNGKLVDWANAKTHILTHALHYGSGVFEGIRCYNTDKGPAVFRLKEHIKRFRESAKIYQMQIPYTQDQLEEAVKETVSANKLKTCYIRPIAYRGYGEMGLNPLDAPVDVSIACWEWGTYLGEEGIKKGIKATISSVERFNPNVMPCRAKATGQYLNSILAKLQSLNAGYDEAVMLDSRGMVSEGPGENIFTVKDEVLTTPPEYASILLGITRDTVMSLAEDMGYDVYEEDIDRGALAASDEVFFTGTAAEITPIREIDGVKLGPPGPVTKKLQESFFEIVSGKEKRYSHWLHRI